MSLKKILRHIKSGIKNSQFLLNKEVWILNLKKMLLISTDIRLILNKVTLV
jgi:hypothetical protein